MLPIGLNMCTPGDQELISLAKRRYSLVRWMKLHFIKFNRIYKKYIQYQEVFGDTWRNLLQHVETWKLETWFLNVVLYLLFSLYFSFVFFSQHYLYWVFKRLPIIYRNKSKKRNNNQNNNGFSILSRVSPNYFTIVHGSKTKNVQFTQNKEIKYQTKGNYFRTLQRITDNYASPPVWYQQYLRCGIRGTSGVVSN